MSDDDADLTLAFSLAAAERLANPGEAFAEARRWARYLGVVSQGPRRAERFAEEHGVPQDFFTGHRGTAESLGLIRERFETDRYVFVDASESDRRLADSLDWEYRSIEEAAEKAGWELSRRHGLWGRIRESIEGLLR